MANLIFNGTISTDGETTTEVVVTGNQIEGQIVGGPRGETGAQGPQGDPGVVQAVVAGTGVTVDATDPANPEVALSAGAQASLALADSAVQNLADLSITATATELNYTDGVTSSIQTQLDSKVPTTRTVNGQPLSSNVVLDIDDVAPTQTGNSGKALVTDGTNTSWQTISGGGAVDSVNGQTGTVVLDQDDVADGTTYKQYSATEKTKLSGIETGADVTDATNVAAAGAVMEADTTTAGMSFVVDEDDMVSNLATKVPTQQSTKAYVDNLLHQGVEPGTAGVKNKYLDRWYAAMENAKTTAVDIVVIGDSISGSIFNLNYDGLNDQLSWSAKLANLLNKRIGITTATSGFLYAKGDSYAPSMTATTGSNPASLFTWGLGGWAVELDNGEYVRQESSMDGISIMYVKHSNGGTMRIRDGGASGTILADIDTYSATTESGHIWTSNALTYASHNIYIENIDAGQVVVVEACYVHSGTRDKGFRVWQSCHGGWWTSFWTLYPYIGLDQIERMQPDLVISAGGTNDDAGNINSRNRALIDAIQAAAPDTDIVMWVPYVGSTYTAAERELLITIADDYSLAYIDATVVTGAINQTGNVFAYDSVHPNETGRNIIATQAYQILGGDPFGTALFEAVKAQAAVKTQNWKNTNGTVAISEFFSVPAVTITPSTGDAIGFYPHYIWNAVTGMPGSGMLVGGLYIAKASSTEWSMGTSTKLILADPTGATHAATKGYVDSGTSTMTNKTLTSPVINTGVSGTAIVDEDDMASNSATKIPTQQSTKAYVDNAPRQKLVTRDSGSWYGAVGNSAASTGHNVSAAQVLMTMPVWLAAGTYDRIAVTTTVAAVSTWRLGVYNCDQTTGDPRGQSLVIDCGTVDMNATPGLLAITTSITIPTTGLYGLTVLCDAFTANPTVYRHDNSSTNLQVIPNVSVNTVETAGRSARFTVRHTGVSTGSLPATHPTGGAWTDAGPRILLRKT